jgi:aspartate ammonia-lyase
MPGKVNPVISEAVAQAAMLAIGNDAIITMAAGAGQLELNAFLPLLAHALLQSLSVLEAACTIFRTRCVEGIEADREACAAHVERSWATVTALAPHIGYARAAELAKRVQATGRSVVEIVVEEGILDAETVRRLLSAEAMTALGYRE